MPDLESLIVRIMLDTGLRDVATMFREQRDVPMPSGDESLIPAGEMDITDLLERDPFFLARDLTPIVSQVRLAIARLGLTRLSPSFVMELARHLVISQASPAQVRKKPTLPRKDYWLVSRLELESILKDLSLHELAMATPQLRPISSLFPALYLELDLYAYAMQRETTDAELLFLPACDELAREASVALEAMMQAYQAALEISDSTVVAQQIILHGWAPLANALVGTHPKEMNRLQKDLITIFCDAVECHTQSCDSVVTQVMPLEVTFS